MSKRMLCDKLRVVLARGVSRALKRATLCQWQKVPSFVCPPVLQRACARVPQAMLDTATRWLSASAQHHLLCCAESGFPRWLATIPDSPVALWVEGDVALLSQPQCAVIGTRNPTPHGLAVVKQLVGPLARGGLVITSGLALGIDGAAHRAALAVQGQTIAVLGSGLQRIYPRQHQRLARELIAAGGALVSEWPLHAPPLRGHFPARNRIISGLSQGVLVIEAGMPSGTLLTVQHALDQGREVMALPGSIMNSKSRGCHHLIQQGAALVTDAAQVAQCMSLPYSDDFINKKQCIAQPSFLCLDDQGRKLLECMGFGGATLTQLVRLSGLSVQVAADRLAQLINQARVQCIHGLYIRCVDDGKAG